MPDQNAFKFSGEAALNYDRYLGPIMFEPSAEVLVSRLKQVDEVQVVLEIACGTGRVTRHLRQKFAFPITLIASDLNPDMLAVAKAKVDDDSVNYTVADAQNLPFADNSIDLIVFQYGIMFVPDKQKGLNEAFRVLKPGGQLYFSTWEKTEEMPFHKMFFNDTLLPLFDDAEKEIFKIPFAFSDPLMLKSWMKQAGFTEIEADRVKFLGQAESPEMLINGFFVKHSMGAEVKKKNPQAFESLPKHLGSVIIEKFGKGPIDVDLTAIFVSGHKPSHP